MASRASAAMRVGVGKSEGAATSLEASSTADDVAGVSPSPGMTRVYMGGLGGGVTEADVEKTFAPLGRVRRVEFVRTKGRSFAFMDFEPKSDKSLAKLFATYNGCIWKGGRLKLEKGKEHYLSRLRREWTEDAEPFKNPVVPDTSKGLISSDKSKPMSEEKMQLRIFFPKLRKVKALPFKGTGKHKYSFQRIATPSLPVHFCDCEVHCQSHEDPNQDQLKYIKDQSVVVNEKELTIMESVMKRLFEKEANANFADSKAFSASKGDILDDSKNETPFGDSEAAQQSDSDADNLVTNIGLGNGEDVLNLMQLKGWAAASPDQEPTFDKSQHSHEKLNSDKQNTWKRQITGHGTVSEAHSSKRARLPSEKSKESKVSSTVTGKIGHQEQDDLPAIQSQGTNYSTEEADVIESKTTQNSALAQSGKSTSWVQKSSWKELVGDSGRGAFTISHVLPSVSSLSTRLSNPNGADNIRFSAERDSLGARLSSPDGADDVRFSAEKTDKPLPSSGFLRPAEVKENVPVKKIAAPRHEDESGKDGKYVVGEGGVDKAPGSSSRQEPKTDAPKIGVGEVCTFMRSADSIKEWTKAKAALSGQLRKKKRQHETGTSEGKKYLSSRR